MLLLRFLSAAAALLAFGQTLAHALPTESPAGGESSVGAPSLHPRGPHAVPCDDISKYTTQWFLDNYIYRPLDSTCLFYTYELSEDAQKFARTKDVMMFTIWVRCHMASTFSILTQCLLVQEIWPCGLYNGDLKDDNPLRCIFKSNTVRTTYFENMSRAMAKLCDKFATVMTKDIHNIPTDGIWGRVEEPTLKETGNIGGQVNYLIFSCAQIEVVDRNGGNKKEIWKRPEAMKAHPKHTRENLARGPALPVRRLRECYSPKQLERWFGKVPW
ncbi:hypothetical protein K440DRAFT_642771 [Wilcoxina mikolae CBS 423.85]|nr:hypothetical protein K440DRAFT_642771 [Wilcoxina mikolae CBS 423.85]